MFTGGHVTFGIGGQVGHFAGGGHVEVAGGGGHVGHLLGTGDGHFGVTGGGGQVGGLLVGVDVGQAGHL